jgi:hypothetical protein
LGNFENTIPSSRLTGIYYPDDDSESPTVYFQTLDRVVAEIDHNAPDAQANLESQLKKLSSMHPEWTEGGKPPHLNLLLKELDRSNVIRLNNVLETTDGYLICREFENYLSIPHWKPLAPTNHTSYSSGTIAWSSANMRDIPLSNTKTLYPHRDRTLNTIQKSADKSQSLGLVLDIEAGLSCNHFSRAILDCTVDDLLFYRFEASGFRAYFIGLDNATRQVNLCHLIDHLFDRRTADNRLLTALHLLVLETELKPQAETSQQEVNPLAPPIKASSPQSNPKHRAR